MLFAATYVSRPTHLYIRSLQLTGNSLTSLSVCFFGSGPIGCTYVHWFFSPLTNLKSLQECLNILTIFCTLISNQNHTLVNTVSLLQKKRKKVWKRYVPYSPTLQSHHYTLSWLSSTSSSLHPMQCISRPGISLPSTSAPSDPIFRTD